MNTTPYWIDTASLPAYPKPKNKLSVDVVVIGGGITGVTAAYLLMKSGATVALLERERFGMRDTGHTTAHLTCVTDTRLSELVKDFGRDHAQAVWDAGAAAIDRIHEIAETEGIDCEFAWIPGYLHAPREADEKDRAALKEDAQLAQELGFEAAYLDKIPFLGRPGVRFANQAKFHPLKYLAGLLNALQAGGCLIFEESDGAEIEEEPLRVTVSRHTIDCKYVVIATHVPLQGARNTLGAALFQTKLAPYTSYVVGAKIPPGLVPEASFWDTGDPYDYLRIDRRKGHDYAIYGGADEKTGQGSKPEQHYAELRERLLALMPAAEVDHQWSGQVVETNDGLPYIGEAVPKQFIATGFSGNGMTFGTVAAMMACDAYTGRTNPWAKLFDPNRTKLLGGAWDYLKENKDYPFYFLKQRLSTPADNSLESVGLGEGKVIQLHAEKIAAYRHENGKVSVKSAICPHMGCVVRWNSAEKTWDCPCHGSRFRCTGDVIAGPAETGLAVQSATG